MFYWGSYNYQVPQQTEIPSLPPLRFPVYVPPSLSVLQLTDQINNKATTSSLSTISQQREREESEMILQQQQQQQQHTHYNALSKQVVKVTPEDVSEVLMRVESERMHVVHASGGSKHLLVLLSLPIKTESSDENHANTLVDESNNNSNVIYRNFLFGMGSNHSGQLGSYVNRFTHTLSYLHVEGEEYYTKCDSASYVNTAGNEIISVACGNKHSIVCNRNGSVFVCGDNSFGQLGLSPQELRRASLQYNNNNNNNNTTLTSTSNISVKSYSYNTSFPSSPTSRANKTHSSVNTINNNTTNNKKDSFTGNGTADHCVLQFTQIMSLAHIVKIFAGHNVSFALDHKGVLYSWGEAQYGQLAHNDDGTRIDSNTMKQIHTNITVPQRVRWFERHHVAIVECSVGKAHMVCMSKDEEVYTCGEGYFGKLGHHDVQSRLEPTRVSFPPRKQTERLIAVAAGDDHTLVLKENSLLGSIVYFFGKLNNGDGQLSPLIIPVPCQNGTISRIYAGRGNMCGCLCETNGKLYVWGKHAYNKVYNGTDAAASRMSPTPISVLERFHLTHMVCGGTFCAVFANALQAEASHTSTLETSAKWNNQSQETHKTLSLTSSLLEEQEQQQLEQEVKEHHDKDERTHNHSTKTTTITTITNNNNNIKSNEWNVIVPHDARVNKAGVHVEEDDEADNDGNYKNKNKNNSNICGSKESSVKSYEFAVRAFLKLYLGTMLGNAYCDSIPAPPQRTIPSYRTLQHKLGAHGLEIGSKVRLWMTDVYALATIVQLNPPELKSISLSSQPLSLSQSQSQPRQLSVNRDAALTSLSQSALPLSQHRRSLSQHSVYNNSNNNNNNSSIALLGSNNTHIVITSNANQDNDNEEMDDEHLTSGAAADCDSDNSDLEQEQSKRVRVKVE